MKLRIILFSTATFFFVTNYNIVKSQITAYPDTTVCSGETLTLYSVVAEFCGDCFTYEEIPYAPEEIGGVATSMVDDTYIGPFDIGFTFCFFGTDFTQFYLCSNGWISFSTPGGGWAGNWTPDGPIPDNAANVPKNAIFGPWTDWYTGLCDDCIHYETIGTSPNQKTVITWEEVPLYECTSDVGTFQIVLYESSNYIDNHFVDVMVCPTWDIGVATQGVQNSDGTIAFAVDGRNATEWAASEESWRWYTSDLTWYDEDGVIVGIGPTTDVTPEETTTYTLVQSLCDGTTLEDDVTVTVAESFDGTLTTTDVSCGGDADGSATINLSGTGPYTYEWSNGATGSNSITGLVSGDYNVIVTAPDGCQKIFEFTISEPVPLVLEIDDIDDVQCYGYSDGSADIITSGGATPYTITVNGDSGAGSILTGLTAGDYDVVVTDANGCEESTTFTINQPDDISIYAGPDLSIVFGASVTIEAEPSTTELSGVSWSPGGGTLNCDTLIDTSGICFSYTVTPGSSGYIIVGITDLNGCYTSDSVYVTVIYTNEVLMPNAFTPNGDNINDNFQGIAFDLATYNMQIFNRWGELMFETNSIDYSLGWDGRYNNEEQEVGSYVYLVNALFNTGISFSKNGTFTLVR